MKKLANEIVAWLKDYAVKNDRRCFVVGVSGGVDSALVSTLCAMTGMQTHCLMLPCQSKDAEIERARKHVMWLLEKYPDHLLGTEWDLSQTFNMFKATMPDDNPEIGIEIHNNLAFANTKSRLRMIALYQVATPLRGLVVGTGNKVEDFGVGFFTKYGDGGVDISPIADLTKTEVRAMAKELGILPELANAVPTDGLWDDARTDETQLGATYAELEWAMQWLEDTKNCYSTVILEGLTNRQKEVLGIYTQRHASSRHKLEPIPTFRRVVKHEED